MSLRTRHSDIETDSDSMLSSDDERLLNPIIRENNENDKKLKKCFFNQIRWTSLGNITLIEVFNIPLFIGPQWRWALVTYIFVLLCITFMFSYLMRDIVWEQILLIIASVAGLSSYLILIVADPGIVKHYDHALMANWTFCSRCSTYRPSDALHCRKCGVCIQYHHHHCGFIGKCVGLKNRYEFRIFFLSMFILLMYTVLIIIINLIADDSS